MLYGEYETGRQAITPHRFAHLRLEVFGQHGRKGRGVMSYMPQRILLTA